MLWVCYASWLTWIRWCEWLFFCCIWFPAFFFVSLFSGLLDRCVMCCFVCFVHSIDVPWNVNMWLLNVEKFKTLFAGWRCVCLLDSMLNVFLWLLIVYAAQSYVTIVIFWSECVSEETIWQHRCIQLWSSMHGLKKPAQSRNYHLIFYPVKLESWCILDFLFRGFVSFDHIVCYRTLNPPAPI